MASPTNPIQSNTGDAPIIKQGHTTNSSFGSDPDKKVMGSADTVRDLSINVTGGGSK